MLEEMISDTTGEAQKAALADIAGVVKKAKQVAVQHPQLYHLVQRTVVVEGKSARKFKKDGSLGEPEPLTKSWECIFATEVDGEDVLVKTVSPFDVANKEETKLSAEVGRLRFGTYGDRTALFHMEVNANLRRLGLCTAMVRRAVIELGSFALPAQDKASVSAYGSVEGNRVPYFSGPQGRACIANCFELGILNAKDHKTVQELESGNEDGIDDNDG
jgi:hypothetical protein